MKKKRILPEGFCYYLVYVRAGLEMVGPYDVISNNTIESSPNIQKIANKAFPNVGFGEGEVTWFESEEEPDDSLLEDFWKQQDSNAKLSFNGQLS